MGLQGIHHPNALHHHTRLSYCPWCRKEGQKEGTVINHLQTMHYQLGLVCGGFLHFPTTTSEAMQCHGQWYRQPRESDAEEEDGGPLTHHHQTDLFETIPSGQNTVCHGSSDINTLAT